MRVCMIVIVIRILMECSCGIEWTEIYPLMGVETCKSRCAETRDCRAVVYLTGDIACKIYINHRPISSDISSSSILVPLPSISHRKCAKSCKTSSCIITKSSSQICRVKGIPGCYLPNQIRHTGVTIVRAETEVKARYRCSQHYDVVSHPGSAKHVTCSAEKGWDTVRLHCQKVGLTKKELISNGERLWKTKLPLKLELNRHVEICGFLGDVPQISINLNDGKSILLHINPRFSQGKKDQVTKLFLNDCPRGTWGKDVEKKNPFAGNSSFCVTVFNFRNKYFINVDGKKVTFKKRNNNVARSLVVSKVTSLTSVEMGKGRRHVSHPGS